MQPRRILIANRGEIACRLVRTYQLFPLSPSTPSIETVAIYTPSEANAVHVSLATLSHQLASEGPRAYLDKQAIVDAALQSGCWGVAPGYGFLSEDAEFAGLCESKGLVFLGPTEQQLARLGDKVVARELANSVDVPVLEGTKGSTSSATALNDILTFAKGVSAGSRIILKAANGGGGRGIRVVTIPTNPTETHKVVQEAYESCSREAAASFGDGTVYAERFLVNAKHVEVQVLGDGRGGVCHFWDRECSLQRRNQKLIEIAPAPHLPGALRKRMLDAALRLAKAVNLRSLATIEFLVEPEAERFYFMEANPRIQVEHTITENVTGHDLVALQLLVGLGHTLPQLGMQGDAAAPFSTKTAIQLRVNAESFRGETDETHPEAGAISSLIWPVGGYVRIETAAHAPHPTLGQYKVNPLFDSLLAKVIVTAPTYGSAVDAARRALHDTTIGGVRTNLPFLLALLSDEGVQRGRQHIHTVQSGFKRFLQDSSRFQAEIDARQKGGTGAASSDATGQKEDWKEEQGKHAIRSHLSGLVVKLSVQEGDKIALGQELAVLEAMKMEHVVRADAACAGGVVHKILVQQGGVVNSSDVLIVFDTSDAQDSSADSASSSVAAAVEPAEDPEVARPELKELQQRRLAISDAGRIAAVTKRHARGFRTVRENLSMLLDPDSFLEYGGLVTAAQRKRYSPEDLIARTSGDGIVTGFGRIDAHTVGLIMGDYLVLAGTQGYFHHLKLDRILTAVLSHPAPLVLYAEGGGGRPGDTDFPTASGLMTPSFALMGQVRAQGIPVVGVANGYVFAGNAALLGTCDVVIATRGGNASLAGGANKAGKTSIGMGGKAMIEAGGLGIFESDEIGPTSIHADTGGVDIVVADEDAAAAIARKVVGHFTQPRLAERQWVYSQDVKLLRTCLPSVEERRRAFDMRRVISLLVDDSSFVELAPDWGKGMITGFARIKGQSVAILANDPTSPLGGAIDINAALKAVRLLKLLARTRATHLISLCDTPGFMVGPEFERTSTAGGSFRTFGDWFTAAAEFTQSGGRVVGLVLRRAFGLGAQAMLGGSTLSNSICASWPAGSLGPMSLEGAVQLSMKKQLAQIEDEAQRKKVADKAVEGLYRNGRAINVASMAEIDTVLDPAETRDWLAKVVIDVLGDRTATYKLRKVMVSNPHL
ncbi:Carbamoyl-phosphate synthetase large subunit-like, ATP-binding domain protein [Kalmanozyma brasiliensis GHG001]|uniref:Pyruvate carboxylase n=1 Tax=Kalmanozyma brasiliensis (strain GHG001) TaxID=1365824 RepID=V5GMV5_KALBG|nr:Carbamoyl-phosphate synthetase large subunit-like, ATP-binding domain protein [Kalmanozyma brasiliensis GHG001]EST07307.1 Carbamoyl-phosphate synthetase large subunit-like, ATP-binding domain protein [Kalmanozyma brasiliensis GHG001]